MKLLVVIPLAHDTVAGIAPWLARLVALGPYTGHQCLLVADHGLSKAVYEPIVAALKPAFDQGQLIHTEVALPDLAFPVGHNFRFEAAVRFVNALGDKGTPFLWLETNAVPLRRGWLREVEEEYFAARKPFLGQLMTAETHSAPLPMMSAVGVYPAPVPKPIIQRLIAQRRVNREQSCAEFVVPNARASLRIVTRPFTGAPDRWDKDEIYRLPPMAALVHTSGARALLACLAGETPPVEKAETVVVKPPTAVTPVATAVVAPRYSAYYHSGNLGDIVYGLYAIKAAGGGKLILGPRQIRTSPAGNAIRKPVYELLAPLLAEQAYLNGTAYSDRHPGTTTAFDLNTFRNNWSDQALRDQTGINNLAQMHFHTVGIYERFRSGEAWLKVPAPIRHGYWVAHRSMRYRNAAFPWSKVVKALRPRLLFTGLPEEFREFRADHGTVAYWQPANFLEMASVIAGAKGFVGNQSFPCALAIALGVPVLQESWDKVADCLFPRANFLTQPFTDAALLSWMKGGTVMTALPVTLVAIDTVHPFVTLEAMRRTMLWCQFPSTVLVTDIKRHPSIATLAKSRGVQCAHEPQGDRHVTVTGIGRRFYPDYEVAMLVSPLTYIGEAEHVLYMEWDSGVLNPTAWNPKWLDLDYIGAPWPRHQDPGTVACDGKTNAVGNTGFSLRSRRFLELTREALAQLPDPSNPPHPSDSWLCRTKLAWFQQRGVRFAPVEVAERFSCEDRVYSGQFGYHGKTTIEINGWGGWMTKQIEYAKRR